MDRIRTGVLMAVLAAALIACTGGGDPTPVTTEPVMQPTGDDGTSNPTQGDTFLAASPDSLTSYRYRVEVTMAPEALGAEDAPAGLDLADTTFSITVTGTVINPDRESSTTEVDLGFLSLTFETIRIGDQEWTRQGSGRWQETVPGEGLSTDFLGDSSFTPGSIFNADEDYSFDDLTARLGSLPFVTETVNGIQARRYTLTQEEFDRVFQSGQSVLPEDSGLDATVSAEIWLAEDLGVPIRMVVIATLPDGEEVLRLELNLTDINDGSITIEPPV